MGVTGPGEQSTICGEGCAMTCVAMVISGKYSLADGIDPAALNAWLQAHHGYHCMDGDCNNLVVGVVDRLTGGRARLVGGWPVDMVPPSAITSGLIAQKMAYIAHVHNPVTGSVNHFVLVTSYDNATDSFAVLDPLYNATRYARANVSQFLMYELLPRTAVVPLGYPLYMQCDPRWGADRIHIDTICAVGCLMSSTAMALQQRGITIEGAAATPHTLNAWLLRHHGYVGGTDDLDESALTALDPARIQWTNGSMHTHNDLSWDAVVTLLDAGAAVIANVMAGRHFVLVVGYDRARGGDALYVNDPFFTIESYSYSTDIVGWRLYAMAHAAGGEPAVGAQTRAISATAMPDTAAPAAKLSARSH